MPADLPRMPRKLTRPAPDPASCLRSNIETAPLDVRDFDDRAVKFPMNDPDNMLS